MPHERSKGRDAPPSVRGYLRQSPFSDPGPYAELFDALPDDVPRLAKIVQGLVVHYRSADLKAAKVPPARYREVNLRYVHRMLQRLHELDPRALDKPRPIDRRVIGCCRDFATLFVSMARHQGIPARIRVGFANYFEFGAGQWIDHTIAERWQGARAGWRLIDPEQTPASVREKHLSFEPTDVPRDRFVTGGDAWRMCREEGADPARFCVLPGDGPKGLWFVRTRVLLDLAALNREELLLWDSWGETSPDMKFTSRQLSDLDRLAAATRRTPPSVAKVSALYRSKAWHHPERIICYSPVGRPFPETLRS